jgi:hypothetical protein
VLVIELLHNLVFGSAKLVSSLASAIGAAEYNPGRVAISEAQDLSFGIIRAKLIYMRNSHSALLTT